MGQKQNQDNKKKKRVLLGLLFGILGAGAIATAISVPLVMLNKKDPQPEVKTMIIKQSNGSLVPTEFELGEHELFELAVYEENGQKIDKAATYASSNANVATINGSIATINAIGSTTITATCEGYEQAQVAITVKGEIEPTEPFDCEVNECSQDMTMEGGFYISSGDVEETGQTFEANTEYTFTIDFADWEDVGASFDKPPTKLQIMNAIGGSYSVVGSISSISIWFNHTKWAKDIDYELKEENGLTYIDWSKTTSTIEATSTLTGKFKLASKAENAFLITHPASS